MAINYSWQIANLDVTPSKTIDGVDYTDVIKTVHWRLVGVDDVAVDEEGITLAASVYGTVDMDNAEITAAKFVQFDDLTPEKLAMWAGELINAAEAGSVDGYKATIAQRIEDQKNPPIVSKLPSETTVLDAAIA